jgi:hypothetical protein
VTFVLHDNASVLYAARLNVLPNAQDVSCWAHVCRNITNCMPEYMRALRNRDNKEAKQEIIRAVMLLQTVYHKATAAAAIKILTRKFQIGSELERTFIEGFMPSNLTFPRNTWILAFNSGVPATTNS